MELHVENLEKLCRVCKEIIALKPGPYMNPKHEVEFDDVLETIYNISVSTESEECFPKKLCSNCTRKLRRLDKN